MERAQAFMEQRRQQALYICQQGDSGNPYYPFYLTDYVHKHIIPGKLPHDYRARVTAATAPGLIPVDPFTPSPIRESGLMIWDAAAGIPAAVIRPQRVIKTRMLPTNRNTNTHWSKNMLPALGRVGRLTPDSDFIRPRGPFIYDLLYDPVGWRLLEGAHALAHRVAELKPAENKKKMLFAGSTHFHTQRFLTLLCACRAYGLPMDTWCFDEGKPGAPDIGQYGIAIKSSSYFRTPILKLPAANREAPRPDETVALLSAGVFLEPHPHGATTGTGNWREVNRWACSPTAVIIAGWELIDVVAHQPLCSSDPDDRNEPICYGMGPADLQSPDTFWAYLRYAAAHNGMPAVDNKRYWYVEDWLESEDYRRAVGEAPPLPCWSCLRLNMKAEGAPRRPEGNPPRRWEDEREDRPDSLGRPPSDINKTMDPDKGKPKAKPRVLTKPEQEWTEWEQELAKIWAIIDAAVVYYEGRLVGHRLAPVIRARRRGAYARRLKRLHRIQKLNEAIAKAYAKGMPSDAVAMTAERNRLMVELNEGINACCPSASTSESTVASPPSAKTTEPAP